MLGVVLWLCQDKEGNGVGIVLGSTLGPSSRKVMNHFKFGRGLPQSSTNGMPQSSSSPAHPPAINIPNIVGELLLLPVLLSLLLV